MPKDQTICIVPEIIYDANSGKSYTKGKLLGKGTFGKYYEIRESQLHRTFAVKIVGKAQITKSNYRETMTQEVSIHRTLNHKNVIGFYDFFDDPHNVYMILELCHNRTMLELHLRRKALTECETRYYMMQILEGVNYLHQNKIIHRDLKLANLFLNDDLQVKIGDFGLAVRLEHKVERRRTGCGTLDYMAPEILARASHSYEVDIWSIGCIMYILLVGKTPFEGFSTTEIISRIQLVQYKIPSTVNRIPRNMITNMLQGNPSKRPSIEQLIANPFFTCGFMPPSLPLSCLTMAPGLDMLKMHNKCKPPSEMNNNVEGEGQDFVFRVPVRPARKNLKFEIKKMLETLTEQLAAVLKSEPGRETTSPADEITDPAAQPVVWISKWVDYLEKFGFGYQLSDNGVGVIYNDGTRLIMLANCFNIYYINREGNELYYTVREYPPDLEGKMKIMNCFLTHMKERLMKAGSSATVKPCDAMSMTPYVYQWFRTQSAVVMQLTNGTIQINFLDHTKIIMCPLMAAVTYVDEKNFITYKFQTIQENGCCIDLANKLMYAYEKLALMLSYP